MYLDDIIVYSKTKAEHIRHSKLVADKLKEFELKIKLDKCKFAKEEIEYLSHIISNGQIRPNPKKIEAISNFTRPQTVKKVQSFLGLVSYYRKFIEGRSTIMSPLIKLTEKGAAFD